VQGATGSTGAQGSQGYQGTQGPAGTKQAHIADAYNSYTADNMGVAQNIANAINAQATKFNSLLAELETFGALNAS
jgi:hypothetical protein